MSITTVSARDFARDLASAKRAADAGPVFVTDRGRPTFALLKIEDYYKLVGNRPQSLLELMESVPCEDGLDFDAPRMAGLPRDVPLD